MEGPQGQARGVWAEGRSQGVAGVLTALRAVRLGVQRGGSGGGEGWWFKLLRLIRGQKGSCTLKRIKAQGR